MARSSPLGPLDGLQPTVHVRPRGRGQRPNAEGRRQHQRDSGPPELAVVAGLRGHPFQRRRLQNLVGGSRPCRPLRDHEAFDLQVGLLRWPCHLGKLALVAVEQGLDLASF